MTTHGGISVLNAIPLGLGSTCAVDLKVTVTAGYGGRGPSSSLVETVVKYFSEKSGSELNLEITSEIPEGGGLKSSSAVATASISALSQLTGIHVDVPMLAARLSLEAGVSVTGALDDATAAFYGGISVCDNSKMKIIRRASLPQGLSFVILPRGPRKDFDPMILRKNWPSFKHITGMVLKGNYVDAMARNGLTVSEVLGYETDVLLKTVEMGAIASGVTGNGPSLFALMKAGEESPVEELFSDMGKPIIKGAV